MYVKDLEGNEYALQATVTNDYELNGNQSLSSRILPTKVNKQFINNLAEMWHVIDHDDVEHKIIYAKRKGEGNLLSVEIKATPLFFDVLDNDRIYDNYNEHMTAQLAFTRIFNDTGFNFVLVDQFEAVQWEGFGDGESKLETFKRALNRYKAEFRIVGNTVYIHKLIGRDTNFMYSHRLNASNIVQEVDASQLWTYAKGYGDYEDGEEGGWENAKLVQEYTSPLAKIIGIRHAPPIKDGRIKDKSTMDESLKTLVDESLKVSVSATIHDLRKQGYALGQPELGDRTFLTDERIGLNDEVRIVNMQIVRNWKGEVIDLNLIFGSEGITKRHMSNMNTAIKDITDIMAGNKKIPMSAYDNAVINATALLKKVTSELAVPDNGGLMAIDKDNPNNVVLFNAAGIGVSDDGGGTFKNSITGQGVVAETIIGQSIIGVNLSSIDEAGYFHVNGSSAEFVNTRNNRKVEISPDGIYGYNGGGSTRFQADSTFVTSSAFGTSNANVYLAAQAGNEARVVDFRDIPGDGFVDSYRYLPLRASGFYGNFWNINPASGTNATNLYARPLSAGELRVTANQTTDLYRDARVREMFANAISYNAMFGDSTHLFLRSAGEIRATRAGSSVSLIPMRARGFYGEFIDLDATDSSAVHLYVRPSGSGMLKVTARNTTDTFRAVQALRFVLPDGSSAFEGLSSNLNVKPHENEAIELVRDIELIRYTEENEPAYKYKNTEKSIDEMLGTLIKAVQELSEKAG